MNEFVFNFGLKLPIFVDFLKNRFHKRFFVDAESPNP